MTVAQQELHGITSRGDTVQLGGKEEMAGPSLIDVIRTSQNGPRPCAW